MKCNMILSGLALIAISLQSCDSYHPIAITNTTANEASIYVVPNLKFHTQKQIAIKDADGFEVYKLAPNEAFIVGHAISELDDDIPFSELKIITEKDTVFADNPEAIKDLFDKNLFGGVKSRYNISVK